MDYNQLRQYIRSFSLDNCARGNQGYNQVLLQLFGFMGHGKSSFINSCKYVLEEQYNMVAKAGHGDGQSITMERRSYELTDTIHIVDNRGFGLLNDFEMTEIYSQLANFLPLNECVDWTKSFAEIVSRIEDSEPQFSYLIVPVFVYSSLMTMNDQEQTQIISFLRTCHEMTGIYPTIIITNKSRRDPREMAEKFRLMGAGKVFLVENYTTEDHLPSRERHTNILDIIKNVLEDVNFLMERERNPEQDRKAFKKRLINMAHENVLTKMKQEEERKQKEYEMIAGLLKRNTLLRMLIPGSLSSNDD